MSIVYLAGPITGLNYDGAQDWREKATSQLAMLGIDAVSPLRGKEYLRRVGELSGHGRDYVDLGVLSTPKGVTTRDRFDATRCDVLLVNLLDAERVSIGTMIELGWADANRIPIVLAVPPKHGHPHDHMMVSEIAGYIVHSLDEALHVVGTILA